MPELTVATLNLFNRQGRWSQRAPLVVDQFLEIGPDVTGLQEVYPGIDQANWPTGQTIGLMKDTFHSAYEAVNGREAERTWPTPLVFSLDPSEFPVPIPRDAAQPLDYIFVSKGIKVLEARVVFDQPAPSDETLYASDHFGVTSRLSFH